MSDWVKSALEQKWGETVETMIHADLHPSSSDIPETIKRATPTDLIVIVDDVSVTGQRLSKYQQNLRQLHYSGRIIYLLGVARPENEKDWLRRETQLAFRDKGTKQHTVISVEKVILPDWDHRMCPWCFEIRALAQLVSRGRLSGATESAVLKRINALQKSSIQKGLVDDAVWRPEGSNAAHLTQNSIFIDVDTGPATAADVIAAVSAALQQMRIVTKDQDRLQVTFPHVAVLNADNYFGDRFNDDVLRVAILRCARAAELERWDTIDEENRRNKVRDFLFSATNRDMFRLELAVARLGRKIPHPDLSDKDWQEMEGWPAKLWDAFPD